MPPCQLLDYSWRRIRTHANSRPHQGLSPGAGRQLRPHPRNWRTHPAAQQDALRGVLAEIGYADALLARELADGSLQLIDGHLRAETDARGAGAGAGARRRRRGSAQAAGHARSAGGHGRDRRELLSGLLAEVKTDNEAVRAAAADAWPTRTRWPTTSTERPLSDLIVPEAFQVVVECRDEDEQRDVCTSGWRPKDSSAACCRCRSNPCKRARTRQEAETFMTMVQVEVSCPVYDSFRVQQVAGMFDVPLAERSAASFAVEVPGGRRSLADRPDRRALGQRQDDDRPAGVRRALWPTSATGRPTGRWSIASASCRAQADHRPADGRRLQLAAGLDQALPRAQRRRAVSLRPGPGAGARRMRQAAERVEPSGDAADRGLRRVHQRRRSQRGADRLGGGGQGDSRRADSPAGSWPSLATTTWPSGSSPTGSSTWPTRHLPAEASSATDIELELFRCRRRRGDCLRRITI